MRMKHPFFFGFIVLLCVFCIISYILFKNTEVENERQGVVLINLDYVVIHFDLKGAPPRIEYLLKILPTLKNMNVNAILLEYEDMFPYEGKLANLSARNCYSKSDLSFFIEEALYHNIEIIPLIQTFGHMEYILKLEEFRHLREDDMYPDSICPNNPESISLIDEILQQVIGFHLSITPLKHIHIGCDEVLNINKCDKCRDKRLSDINLYMNHLIVIKEHVLNISPSTTILIWDDMIRNLIVKFRKLEISKIWNLIQIELVCWHYYSEPSISELELFYYRHKLDNIWIASAYAGVDGRQAIIPNYTLRFLNNFNWMKLISNYDSGGEHFHFKGIILTGRTRYSHMDPLCELIPTATPSLVLNTLLIKKFQNGIYMNDTHTRPELVFNEFLKSDFLKHLSCKKTMKYVEDFESIVDSCKFDGVAFFSLIRKYEVLVSNIFTSFGRSDSDISSIEHNIKANNINMNHKRDIIKWFSKKLRKLIKWEESITTILLEFYDNYVIDEFIEHKVYYVTKKLEETLDSLMNYNSTQHVWLRNPRYINLYYKNENKSLQCSQ